MSHFTKIYASLQIGLFSLLDVKELKESHFSHSFILDLYCISKGTPTSEVKSLFLEFEGTWTDSMPEGELWLRSPEPQEPR